MPQITLEQLAGVYSTLPGATSELGGQFAELMEIFIKGYMEIARKQGLTNEPRSCIEGGETTFYAITLDFEENSSPLGVRHHG